MAGMVGSAVVQDGVSRVVSFVLGKREEKASKGHIIERLEMAHNELELALERSSKLPITDRSLLRRRKILKRAYEECGNVLPDLPLVGLDGKVKTEPLCILERRIVQRRGDVVAQWLIQWQNLAPEEATWEDVSFIRKVFPNFQT